jgi:hypothetical protein
MAGRSYDFLPARGKRLAGGSPVELTMRSIVIEVEQQDLEPVSYGPRERSLPKNRQIKKNAFVRFWTWPCFQLLNIIKVQKRPNAKKT